MNKHFITSVSNKIITCLITLNQLLSYAPNNLYSVSNYQKALRIGILIFYERFQKL